jgi:hypothetical protein
VVPVWRKKIEVMEKKYDTRFQAIFTTIKQMLETPVPAKRRIEFHGDKEPLQGNEKAR